MRAARALLTAILLLGLGGNPSWSSNGCGAPGYFMHGDSLLERVRDVAAATGQLKIVVFGTASSTLGGANGARDAYPARLEAALRESLPGITVNVSVHARPRQVAEKMIKTFNKIVEEEKPSLVIWQTGTFDAIQGVSPREFLASLTEGVETLKGAGIDVILVNMQYNPRTEGVVAVEAYSENMRWVARERQVPLFDRLGIMRYWNEAGIINLHSASRDLGVAKRVHECLGRALAALIIDAGRLSGLAKRESQ